jgi:hypothetical protein
VTLTRLEITNRYRARRLAEIAEMPLIACECGCGTRIPPISKKLRPQRFVHGHNPTSGGWTPERPGVRKRERYGAENHSWKGGESRVGEGYVMVTLPNGEGVDWPTAHHMGGRHSVMRSHLVWNRVHPDDLVQKKEHVHHMNHVRDDDRPENLMKLHGSDHLRMHNAERHR